MKILKLIFLSCCVLSFALMPIGDTVAAQDSFKLIIYKNDENSFFGKEGNQLNGQVYEVSKGTPIGVKIVFFDKMNPEAVLDS